MANTLSRYKEMKNRFIPNIPPLKKIYRRSGFITYLFFHRSKIIKWNNESDLIVFKYWGLKMSLSSDFKSRLDIKFATLLSKLKIHLETLIKSGWKMPFISIYEYNILINFKKFYDKYYQIFKAEDLVKSDFLNLERTYVAITYRESYIDALFNIFEKYLITYNSLYEDNREKFDELFFNLKVLFEKSSLPHSLRELILAYNVTDLQAYYRWRELFPPISTEIVQREWYDCDSDVFKDIVSYYKKVKNSMKSMEIEREKLLRLKSNCIIDDSDSPPILVDYYETHRHNWEIDKGNYYLLFLITVNELLKDLETFILRGWDIIDDNETLISRRLINDDELPAKYRRVKRETDMANVYLNNSSSTQRCSVDSYRESDNLESLAKTNEEKKMILAFRDILDTLFNISNQILDYRDIAIESNYSKNSYLNYMLDSPSIWAGKPVFSLFNYYIELIWTICGYFRHETFVNMDERLREIDENIGKVKEELGRVDSFNLIDGLESEE